MLLPLQKIKSIMVQQNYFLKKNEDAITSIRHSEQDFHKSHAPLYANYLFGNSFVMSKIENYLVNGDKPIGTTIKLFGKSKREDNRRLHNGALICGMELVNGKIDFEANRQIAKHSQNILICAFSSINDNDLVLVNDEKLSDNSFILKYIPDNDDEDDTEIIYSPDEKQIFTMA